MKHLISLALLSAIKNARGDFGNLKATCYLPLDVMFLQDTTGSFIDDLPNVLRQIPDLLAQISQHNPNSMFGIAEFRDKPYLYLGNPPDPSRNLAGDYCYRLTHQLGTNVSELATAYAKLFASGGSDLPEAMLQSIINLVNDGAVGWRTLERNSPDANFAGARLIIMSTDAVPHDPDDVTLYSDVPPMLPYPNDVSGLTPDDQCRHYEYPSDTQMGAQLVAHNTYLAILTPDDDAKVTARWRQINDDVLGNPPGFYQFIRNDSSNILAAILEVMDNVTKYVCDLTTTPPPTTMPLSSTPTTAAPTTLAPTTAAPTTAAPTTAAPTTLAPTTAAPTTAAPTTLAPTTAAPTTLAPTTAAPTTLAPTTAAPTTTTHAQQSSQSTTKGPCPTPCPNPCPNPCPQPPCCECKDAPKMLVKLNHRPKKLRISYDD